MVVDFSVNLCIMVPAELFECIIHTQMLWNHPVLPTSAWQIWAGYGFPFPVLSEKNQCCRLICETPFAQHNGITDPTKAHNSSTDFTVTSFVRAVFISTKLNPSSLPKTGDEIARPSRNIYILKTFSHTFHLYLVQGLFFKGFASNKVQKAFNDYHFFTINDYNFPCFIGWVC